MKPTRNIVKPNSRLWTPKRNIWFKKNDDDQLGMGKNHEGENKASKNITKITQRWKGNECGCGGMMRKTKGIKAYCSECGED